MGLPELSAVLWKERHLLELLLFKLETEQLLLAAGRSRWLARASGEVEMVLGELRHTELERAVATTGAAAVLGLGDGASLRELADAAPAPWRNLLTEHRSAFLALTDEVSELVRTNRELLGRGQRSVHQVLSGIGADWIEATDPETPIQHALSTVGSRYHQIEGADLPATVIDLQLAEVAYQAALGATAKIIQPSLLDFLR